MILSHTSLYPTIRSQYLTNDFRYLDKTTADADTDTCLMYYDLTKLVD